MKEITKTNLNFKSLFYDSLTDLFYPAQMIAIYATEVQQKLINNYLLQPSLLELHFDIHIQQDSPTV